jgi:hypothetical protein
MANTTTLATKTTDFYEEAKKIEERINKFNDLYDYDPLTNTYTAKTKAKTYLYPYKGRKNQTNFPEFVNICKMSAKKLKQYLCGVMKMTYKEENTIIGDGYIYCRGNIPVLLTAHMDTVHKELVKDYYEDVQTDENGNTTHTISSPQGIGGDDRCGIYAILKIIESGYIPYVLFCEDEEVGGIGSNKFCKTKYITELSSLKFLIELDRANANDLVFYQNANQDWIDWVEDETNWKKSWGTFSDISHLSPACEISSVNLSCGYYKAHTVYEYVIIEELLETIEMTKHLLDASKKVEAFVYEERKYNTRYYGMYNTFGGEDYDDDFDDLDYYYYRKCNGNNYGTNYDYSSYKDYYKSQEDEDTDHCLEIVFTNEDDEEETAYMTGKDEAECWKNFFFTYFDVCYERVLDYYYC